jgi:hypothetical protein
MSLLTLPTQALTQVIAWGNNLELLIVGIVLIAIGVVGPMLTRPSKGWWALVVVGIIVVIIWLILLIVSVVA